MEDQTLNLMLIRLIPLEEAYIDIEENQVENIQSLFNQRHNCIIVIWYIIVIVFSSDLWMRCLQNCNRDQVECWCPGIAWLLAFAEFGLNQKALEVVNHHHHRNHRHHHQPQHHHHHHTDRCRRGRRKHKVSLNFLLHCWALPHLPKVDYHQYLYFIYIYNQLAKPGAWNYQSLIDSLTHWLTGVTTRRCFGI